MFADFSPGWVAAWLPSNLAGAAELIEIGWLYALVFLLGVAFATLLEQGMALGLPFPRPADQEEDDKAAASDAEPQNKGSRASGDNRDASSWRVRARIALESPFANVLINFLHAFTVFGGMALHMLATQQPGQGYIPASASWPAGLWLRVCGSVLVLVGVYDFGRTQGDLNIYLHLHHFGALFAIWGNFYMCGGFSTQDAAENVRQVCREAVWRDALLFTHMWAIHGLHFFLHYVLPAITCRLYKPAHRERSPVVEVGKHVYSVVTVCGFYAVFYHEHAFLYQTFAVVLMCVGRYGHNGNARNVDFFRRIEFPGFVAAVFSKTTLFGDPRHRWFGVGLAVTASVCYVVGCVREHLRKRRQLPKVPCHPPKEPVLVFDGSFSLATPDAGDGLPSGNAPYTLEAILRPQRDSATSFMDGWKVVCAFGTDTPNQVNGLSLNVRPHKRGGGNFWHSNDLNTEGRVWEYGEWLHLCATYDGRTRKVYFNGVEECAKDHPRGEHNVPKKSKFYVGCWTLKELDLDEATELQCVRIWSRALESDEVRNLCGQPGTGVSGTGSIGLARHYVFSPKNYDSAVHGFRDTIAPSGVSTSSGTVLELDGVARFTDGSEIRNEPPLRTAQPQVSPPAPSHSVLAFDGTFKLISRIPDPSLPSGNAPYTVETLARCFGKSKKSFYGWKALCYYGADTQNQLNGLSLNTERGGGGNFWHSNDANTEQRVWRHGEWVHVAATFDGRTRRVFFNGSKEVEDTPGVHKLPTASKLYVGCHESIKELHLDEATELQYVRIWSRALDSEEVRNLCRQPKTGRGSEGLARHYVFSPEDYDSTAGGFRDTSSVSSSNPVLQLDGVARFSDGSTIRNEA